MFNKTDNIITLSSATKCGQEIETCQIHAMAAPRRSPANGSTPYITQPLLTEKLHKARLDRLLETGDQYVSARLRMADAIGASTFLRVIPTERGLELAQ